MRLNPCTTHYSWDTTPLYNSSLTRPLEYSAPPLPPFELCKQLYNAQHVFIGSILCSVQPDDFYERLNSVYTSELDISSLESRLNMCQVLMILSLGQMYSINQWTNDEGPPGFTYFKSALHLLPEIHETPSLLFIEVLAYVAYYMHSLNRPDSAFIYVSVLYCSD